MTNKYRTSISEMQVSDNAEPVTAEQLLEQMRSVIASIPACPFLVLMRKHGCDPGDGWMMVIPKADAGDRLLPPYVIASPYVTGAVFLNAPAAGSVY
jgi:hypothetical protein